jgi:DNA-directed RNA polymerase subunit RPC12/RpoP
MKYDKKYRGRSIGGSFYTQNDKVVIASDEGNERTEYICSHCSSVLVRLNGNEEEMGCSICGVSFIPESLDLMEAK